MKAEHRKELETNVLADQVGRLLHGVKAPRPSPGAFVVLGFLLLAVVLSAGWYYNSHLRGNERSRQWVALDKAGGLDDLQQVSEQSRDTAPGRVARFQRARVLLDRGLQHLFSDLNRSGAQKDLEEAEELYKGLAKEATDEPLLAQEALLGLAKAREARGNLDDARTSYQELADKYPKSPLGEAAAARLKQLNEDPDAKNFYSKLNDLAGKSKSPVP